jgi:hypothetical protein
MQMLLDYSEIIASLSTQILNHLDWKLIARALSNAPLVKTTGKFVTHRSKVSTIRYTGRII